MQATATTLDHEQEYTPINSRNKVLVASLIGTAIEFFDFYIYATAAVIVFPHIFFPQGDPTAATLQSLATFAIAFVARPIGSAVFGHFGDRVGRKATLVASLLTMGISTVVIGLLPGYATIGIFAPLLLALARFGQGLGLGGEWGGAALLATENAPPRKRALYGSFPQLGAPIGFFFANGTFLLLSWLLTDEQFMSWGWRVPFIFSAVLVIIGLYVRVSLHESPVFEKVAKAKKQVKIPLGTLLTKHVRVTVLGTFIMLATYTLFYIMTVYSMTFSTAAAPVGLGLLRNGKPLEVEVTLDTSTSSSASAEMITPALEGATLSDGQLKDGGKGIKIDEVVKGSPAAQAGLQKDDVIIGVNRDRVNSIAEMRKVLAAKPAIIALQIVRGNESIYLLMR